ncbi:hypothetical protein FRX31_014914 [Thalictrum thalictroides]|uniref:Uncharacterized protein n=1 Tax=Thalictrum thalictroides TaxID=46969 RepID=A0A7J6WF40_THATH|nr:hypothetical protein FRX31_014914 [Thalictrum thalictroides]
MLQVAKAQIEQAVILRQKLSSSPVLESIPLTTAAVSVEACVSEPGPHQTETTSKTHQPPLPQPVTYFVTPKASSEDENKKAAAAAVAAKLAAMTSSAQMLTSVLSSLAAEEAASMNGGLKPGGFTPNLSLFPPEKRPKLEKPMPISDMGSSTYFTHGLQHPLSNAPPASSQTIQIQHQLPPPPPPPPLSQPPPAHSYVQSNNVMLGAMPYGYGANSLPPPPPPLPTHMAMGMARPGTPPQSQSSQTQQQPLQPPQSQNPQQQTATGGYYQSPAIGFYGSHHQPTPSLPRQ